MANLWAVEWKSDERVGIFIGAGLEGEDGEFGHVLVRRKASTQPTVPSPMMM